MADLTVAGGGVSGMLFALLYAILVMLSSHVPDHQHILCRSDDITQ
jgi:hypothetical protein